MASKAFAVLAVLFACLFCAHADDPDILSDFVVADGVTPNGDFFTFKGLKQSLWGAPKNGSFKVTRASEVEFQALTGQSVSCAVLQFGPGGINPLHAHPRSSEILLVIQGQLEVGFVDSNNKLFTQVLQTGDMYLFPKGLVHYQFNRDHRYPAVALAAFGSSSPGAVLLPKTLFGSGIDGEVLAKSFKTDVGTVDKLVWDNTMA